MNVRYHLEQMSARHVLHVAKYKLPRPFCYLFRDLDRAAEAIVLRRAMRQARPTRLQEAKEAIILALRPNRTVLFYPEWPRRTHKVTALCALAGFRMVSDPRRAYDVAFKFHDSTVTPGELLEGVDLNGAINARSLDISKRTVARTFEDVFGYPLALDPTDYHGAAVRKSDANATHDGEVIQCPIPATSLDDDAVYERLIDTRTPDGLYTNYRVAVCGAVVPVVLVMYRPADNRFDGTAHHEVVPTSNVLDRQEEERLGEFARAMGLDYGELDVLRDNGDGRIYVVDANNTPGTSTVGGMSETESYKVRWRLALARAFSAMVLEFDRGRGQYAGRDV